jgi:hypothetical protein
MHEILILVAPLHRHIELVLTRDRNNDNPLYILDRRCTFCHGGHIGSHATWVPIASDQVDSISSFTHIAFPHVGNTPCVPKKVRGILTSRNPPVCTLRMRVLHKDALCVLVSNYLRCSQGSPQLGNPEEKLESAGCEGVTHFFKASTTLLVTSSPLHNVSTRYSCTSSTAPTLPMCGFAVLPGRNCPVPSVLQAHSV